MTTSSLCKLLFSLVAMTALGAIIGCAGRQPAKPPVSQPTSIQRGALAITNGINIIGSTPLPAGFVPDLSYAPIWLSGGSEVAIAGSVNGRSALLGFSGLQMTTQRVIAEDYAIGARQGRILDVAASPSAPSFALAIAEKDRVELSLRSGRTDYEGTRIASIPGDYAAGQLRWLDGTTIAIVLEPSSAGAAQPDVRGTQRSWDLYLVKVSNPPASVTPGKVTCVRSRLNFSPVGRFAVDGGDSSAAPELIDLHSETCSQIVRHGPIRVVAWASNGAGFLYIAEGPQGVPGIFRYDRGNGASALIAIASGAASYASDGTIIALGNEQLTWRAARVASSRPVVAQIALIPPSRQEITINSLGFETTPELLARASMFFSPRSDDGVIDVAVVRAPQPLRELIEYSFPARAAFVLAAAAPDSAIALSWSPDGKQIAVVDASAPPGMLTVIAPPR